MDLRTLDFGLHDNSAFEGEDFIIKGTLPPRT